MGIIKNTIYISNSDPKFICTSKRRRNLEKGSLFILYFRTTKTPELSTPVPFYLFFIILKYLSY